MTESSRRAAQITVGAGLALLGGLAAAGLGGYRVNLTPSAPLGLWRIAPLNRAAAVGDRVFICPPPGAAFARALARGYLRPGLCPGGSGPLIKRIAARGGQRVEIGRTVLIDGPPLAASAVKARDAEGRRSRRRPAGSCPWASSSSTRRSEDPMTLDILGRSRPPASSASPSRSSPSSRSDAPPATAPSTPRLVIVAAVVGVIAWSGEVLLIPVAIVFPRLWARAPSRLAAALVSAAYFLAASRGLPQGAARYFETGIVPALALWIAASLAFVGVHAACWTPKPGAARALRYGLAAVLMSVPPFGITGWAHPITAAGVLFPGWGWGGLAAAAVVLLAMTTRACRAAGVLVCCFWAVSALNWAPPKPLDGWISIDTELGAGLGRDMDLRQHKLLADRVRAAARRGARVVILPESALGNWTPTVAHVWAGIARETGVTIIAGAAVIHDEGYDNVLVEIAGSGGRVIYRQRMPVPVAMWQPWRQGMGGSGGARSHMFGSPTETVGGQRIEALVCYELLLVWPVLQSMLRRPRAIVAIANGWWAAGTVIVPVQRANADAWSRLFGLPVVFAFNE